MSGNNYDKYKMVRAIKGKLNLDNPLYEQVVHLLASRISQEDICASLNITAEDIQTILNDPLAQKRLAYKNKVIGRPKVNPRTADECLEFAKRQLVLLGMKAKQDKDKVSALKNLGVIAIAEKKEGPKNEPINNTGVDDTLLNKLTKKSENK